MEHEIEDELDAKQEKTSEIFKCFDIDVFGISPQFCVFSHC
jgi:hypothetical protein